MNLCDRFWQKVKKTKTCWLWTGAKTGAGYGAIVERVNKVKKTRPAHRISYLIHFGELPKGKQVLHKCDNPACVNPGHLFLGSQLDNMRDMVSKNRHQCGSRSAVAKLDEKAVRFMRLNYVRYSKQWGVPALAQMFGVSCPTAYEAIQGVKTWRHVEQPWGKEEL